MRVLISGFCMMAVVVVSTFGQTAESTFRLYQTLSNPEEKYEVMQDLLTLEDESLEPFLTEALMELVSGGMSSYRSDPASYDIWENLTVSVIRKLGEIEGKSAASTIWDVARTAETPVIKADSLIALGNMKAVEYAPEIAMLLRNLNFNARSDADGAEMEAFGAVYALGKMEEEIGIEPLVYASIGWYHDRVTSLARESVLGYSDDLREPFIRILKDAADSGDKRRVLSMMMETGASDQSKAEVAVAALSEGLQYAESDVSRRLELANLRKDAIRDLIDLNLGAPNAPDLLNQAIDRGSQDEKLIAVEALGVDGGDEAVGFLVRRLNGFNDRQDSGAAVNREELALVHKLISALGDSGNELGYQPLSAMAYCGYTNAVIRHANDAMAQIRAN